MASRIPSSPISTPFLFRGNQAEAKTEVKKLRNLVQERLSEAGTFSREFVLLKRVEEDGRNPLFSFYNLNQNALPLDAKEKTSNYLQSLIKSAYPEDSFPEDRLEIKMLHQGFSSYLEGGVENEGVLKAEHQSSTKELLQYLKELHLVVLEREVEELKNSPEKLPFSNESIQEIKPWLTTDDAFNFLAEKEVELDLKDFLGEGASGQVCGASIKGREERYVFKTEAKLKDLNSYGSPFWRQGDCAATRTASLSHQARALFFVMSVETPLPTKRIQEKFYFVPAAQTKAFGMKLPPGSKVLLRAQVMERAEGTNLEKILQEKQLSLNPVGRHFKNIVVGLFKGLQEIQGHHIAHKDIKLENIIYNQTTGKVTFIDFGGAERLRKKNKENDGSHQHSPLSTKKGGALLYISPRILQKEPHGAEVDFFSFAMVILALVNKKELEEFGDARFPEVKGLDSNDVIFKNVTPEKYLDHYLKIISSSGKMSQSLPGNNVGFLEGLFGKSQASNENKRERTYSEHKDSTSHFKRTFDQNSRTGRLLKQYPEIGTIIDLAFQASGPGEEGVAAARELSQLPYFQHPELPAVATKA